MTFISGGTPFLASCGLFGAMLVAPATLAAQELQPPPGAVDKIIGTEVEEEETQAAAEPQKVIAAIEKTAESTATARKVSKLDKVDIVFLSDSAKAEGGPPPEIEAKIREHQAEILQLRQELQGNAMLFHAIDSRQVLVDDVLAVEFDADRAVIYAAAKPPAR